MTRFLILSILILLIIVFGLTFIIKKFNFFANLNKLTFIIPSYLILLLLCPIVFTMLDKSKTLEYGSAHELQKLKTPEEIYLIRSKIRDLLFNNPLNSTELEQIDDIIKTGEWDFAVDSNEINFIRDLNETRYVSNTRVTNEGLSGEEPYKEKFDVWIETKDENDGIVEISTYITKSVTAYSKTIIDMTEKILPPVIHLDKATNTISILRTRSEIDFYTFSKPFAAAQFNKDEVSSFENQHGDFDGASIGDTILYIKIPKDMKINDTGFLEAKYVH